MGSVLEAPGGTRGLEFAEQHGRDIIHLDLAHVLKERQPTRETPVVIGGAYALLLLHGDQRGADGVLQKRLDLADRPARVRDAAIARAAAHP